MANSTKKKSLHIDQQEPDPRDLEDPAHSSITQWRFSKNPPTSEDAYFEGSPGRREVTSQRRAEPPTENAASLGTLGRWIEKITGRLSKKTWRP